MAENPLVLVMYHLSRLPWYTIKFFDWLFTLITAILVYIIR
jgi:hypothetical protein